MRLPQTSRPLLRPFRQLLVTGLLLAAAACSKPEPASVVEIVGAPAPCPGCRVELGPPLELRSANPAERLFTGAPTDVTMDGRGRHWVAELNQPARIFDANGVFLRTLGSVTPAPNEISTPIAFLPLPGDSMLVWTFSRELGNRGFVVDSAFQVARTLIFPDTLLLFPTSAAGWPARLLISGPINSAASAGYTLHIVSADQPEVKVIQSFGPGKLRAGLPVSIANYQRVASAKDSTLWVVDILRYRISHFSKDSTLLGTIERAPDWFPVPSQDFIGTPTTAPPPKIFSIWQAPDGFLWVFGQVPGKNWQDAWPKLAPGAKAVAMSALKMEKLYATKVEVLDPITRNVVSTATLDEYVSNVLPNGNVAVFSVDSANVSHIAIRRLSLAR